MLQEQQGFLGAVDALCEAVDPEGQAAAAASATAANDAVDWHCHDPRDGDGPVLVGYDVRVSPAEAGAQLQAASSEQKSVRQKSVVLKPLFRFWASGSIMMS